MLSRLLTRGDPLQLLRGLHLEIPVSTREERQINKRLNSISPS